jgi:two-component system, chemotaxis family, chemotaxis protein CheY
MSGGAVLIVEDDHDVRDSLSDVLQDAGFEVALAADGLEALALLRGGLRPGVILLDLMMPRMNGFEFRAAQRAEPALAKIPVLVLTADRRARAREAELAAEAYLAKPADVNELIEVLARLLGRPPAP